jgi:endonuclease I
MVDSCATARRTNLTVKKMNTRLHQSGSLIFALLAVLSLPCNYAEDELFSDCTIDEYYGDLLASSPESWEPDAISNLLRLSHRNVLPYSSSGNDDVWDALIDLDSTDGLIRLIYRQVLVDAFDYGTPDTWNREHLWPRSRGVEESGPDNTDAHALRPADVNVNAVRGNLFFGDCQDICTSRPADPEAAKDTARNSDMFLPPASVRGDIARAIFYMEKRYSFEDEAQTETLELTDCPDPEGGANQMAYLSDLLRWHDDDPPDDDERKRNERVCARWQGNRNPFVDYPQLVASLYGPPADKPYKCGGVEDGEDASSPTVAPTIDDAVNGDDTGSATDSPTTDTTTDGGKTLSPTVSPTTSAPADGDETLLPTVSVTSDGSETLAPTVSAAPDGDETLPPTVSPVAGAIGDGIQGTENPISLPPGICSELSAGDVQVVSASAANPDAFVLVALADLPAGLVLYATDNGWTGSDFTSNEGTMKVSPVK